MDVRLSGEFDVAQVDDLLDLVDGALAESAAQIRLDLADVTFIDCAGLGALIEISNRSVGRCCSVSLVDPSARVRRLLVLTGLVGRFVIATERNPHGAR